MHFTDFILDEIWLTDQHMIHKSFMKIIRICNDLNEFT